MLTQKLLQELLFHQSSNASEGSIGLLLNVLKDLSEKVDRLEALLEKRQRIDSREFKNVQRSLLEKVEKQLRHIEETHTSSFTNLSTELKSVKETLESARSKFIGFQ